MLDLSQVNISEYVTSKEAFDCDVNMLKRYNNRFGLEVFVSCSNMEQYREELEEEFEDNFDRICKVGGERVDTFQFIAPSMAHAKAFCARYNVMRSINNLGDELIVKDFNHVEVKLYDRESRRLLWEKHYDKDENGELFTTYQTM